MAILSVAARSLVVVAVRAAGVDLLGVDQAGVEQNADRLGSVELAGESVQAGQQSVGEAGLDRAADRWAAGPDLTTDADRYQSVPNGRTKTATRSSDRMRWSNHLGPTTSPTRWGRPPRYATEDYPRAMMPFTRPGCSVLLIK